MTDPAHHRFYRFAHGKVTRLETAAECLASMAALKKDEFVWFDFFNPAREDLTPLAEPLGLSHLSIEDALDDDQIPKFEDFPTYTFILMNGYRYAGQELSIQEFDFCLGRNFLVSSHRGAERSFEGRWEEGLKASVADVKRGPDFLLHHLVDGVVDRKFAVIETMQEELSDAEDAILEDVLLFQPEQMLQLRRRLLAVRKSLVHEREVLVKICRRDSPFVCEKAVYSYRDVSDHLVRFFESVEICREMVSSLMEMYLSLLNNRMTRAANQTNAVVKRLTYITTIFMPLTLLAGVGGMSEWSMMTGQENWRLSYPLFMVAMTVVGVGSYLLLRWHDRTRPVEDAEEIGAPPLAPRQR